MDQKRTGRFIAQMRKEQKLTQRELAELLNISDKTVSKWECGNGMPELSLMQSVCEALQINLNELFSGQKLSDSDYKNKAEENLMRLMNEAEQVRKNIVGGKDFGSVTDVEISTDQVHKANNKFWSGAGNEVLGAISLPRWSTYLPSEDKLNLLGNLSGKSILDIGFGNGRSLKYTADLGAADLWGLDISAEQIKRAKDFLASQEIRAKLICSPMEEDCGLPTEYYDLVYSVYGIGWTTDLDKTFSRIYSYLKKGGTFVFTWSHPIHKCVSFEHGKLIFSNSYFNEQWYRADINDTEFMLSNRMLSTYINALSDNGFVIEKLVEENDKENSNLSNTAFDIKSSMLPTAFVIKARKPLE